MSNEFNGKRYTTIVKQRNITNCLTGEETKYPDQYGVYDNTTENEVYLPNFKPTCYEDVRKKAIELNEAL